MIFKPYTKTNGQWKLFMTLEPINWCSLVSGNAKLPFLLKFFIENMKKHASEYIHKCPYSGLHESGKVSLSRQFVLIFPNGEYKYDFSFNSSLGMFLEVIYEFEMR
jgi:hypothetical protein